MDGVTKVDEIAIPFEDVELIHLKTKSGKPVKVRCYGVPELVIQAVTESIGGAIPKAGLMEREKQKAIEKNKELKKREDERKVKKAAASAPLMIEAGAVLVGDGGEEVRPAFAWPEFEKPEVPDWKWPTDPRSIPGRHLRFADRMVLLSKIVKLSRGEDPEDSFRDEEREDASKRMGASSPSDEPRKIGV